MHFSMYELRQLPRRLFTIPIRLYRRFLSPLKATPSCRFTPTCSEYAVEAIERWGIIVGTLLSVFRILRCNPFCRGGEDPVPQNIRELFSRKHRDRHEGCAVGGHSGCGGEKEKGSVQ